MHRDEFFNAAQLQRLAELLTKRRAALEGRRAMELSDKVELEALIDAELDGAIARAAARVNELQS